MIDSSGANNQDFRSPEIQIHRQSLKIEIEIKKAAPGITNARRTAVSAISLKPISPVSGDFFFW
jgi:hypothetical protein